MERKRLDENQRRKASGAAVKRPDLTEALFAALFEEWAHAGYTGISLERVATRAGAGKAAIYRRWPSKLEFASEAIEKMSVVFTDDTDCGSLENDLKAYHLGLRRALRHRLIRRILPDLYAERARSSELSTALDRLASYRRERGSDIISRAIARGELSSTIDRELAMDLIPSPLYWRMVILGRRVSARAIDHQVTVLCAALRVT